MIGEKKLSKSISQKRVRIVLLHLVLPVLIAVSVFIFAIQVYAQSIIVSEEKSSDTSNNTRKYASFANLEPELHEIGLTFINASVYPYTTEISDWSNPNIDRISDDTPIQISSESEVNLLLDIIRIANEKGTAIGWNPSITQAIKDAGYNDYFMKGVRNICSQAREAALIDLAANYSLSELIDMGLFERLGMLDEFQKLGFFTNEDGLVNDLITAKIRKK